MNVYRLNRDVALVGESLIWKGPVWYQRKEYSYLVFISNFERHELLYIHTND